MRIGSHPSIVIALATLLCACTPGPREPASAATAPAPVASGATAESDPAQQLELSDACADRSAIRVELTETDDGRAFALEPGDELCIRLPGNRAQSYAWGFNDTRAGTLELVGEPGYMQITSAEGRSDVGGVESWRLRAVKAGTTTLRFEYLHASDEPTPPEKFVTFSVAVR